MTALPFPSLRAAVFALVVSASGLFAAGCASGPEVKPAPEDDAAMKSSVAVERPAQAPAPAAPAASKLSRDEAEEETPRAVTPPAPVAAAQTPAVPERPVDPQARAAFDRGVAASRSGALEVAETELLAALKRDGKLAYGWTNLGVVHERRGNLKAAEDAYLKALEVEPDQELAWDYLTRLRCRSGRVAEAESAARKASGARPAAVGPRIALAYTLLHQSKYDAAAAESKRALKEDERNVRAMQLLSQVYFRQGRFELAGMVLENARAIDPNDPVVLNSIGLVNLQLKAKNQAMEAFKQAVRLQPDYAEANNNYGALLNEAQDYDAAVGVLEAAVAAAPNLPSARLNLGNAYRGRGELPKAVAQYEKVLQLRPDWADTYYNLAILHLDQEVPGIETVTRLQKSLNYFAQYRAKGGRDERVEQYVKDANKGIEREQRRLERLERDKLKRAQEEDERRKREAEEAKARAENEAKHAAEEARLKAEAEEKARRDAEAQAKRDAENAAKAKAEAEAQAKRDAENAAKAKAAAEAQAKRDAEAAAKAEAARLKAEAAAAATAATEKKKKEQEEARRRQNTVPASKLGEEDEEDVVPAAGQKPPVKPGPAPAASGKLSEDDK